MANCKKSPTDCKFPFLNSTQSLWKRRAVDKQMEYILFNLPQVNSNYVLHTSQVWFDNKRLEHFQKWQISICEFNRLEKYLKSCYHLLSVDWWATKVTVHLTQLGLTPCCESPTNEGENLAWWSAEDAMGGTIMVISTMPPLGNDCHGTDTYQG